MNRDRSARARGRSCDVCGGPNRSPRATTCAVCRRRLLELEGADPAQLSLFNAAIVVVVQAAGAVLCATPCACGRADLISSVERKRGKCDRCILDATIEASGIGPVSIVYPDGSSSGASR